MPNKSYMQVQYGDSYKDNAFYIWYKENRPDMLKLLEMLPPNDAGNKPVVNNLRDWKIRFDWDIRADALDAKVAEKMDMIVISDRVEMLKTHAEMGQKMAKIGMDYLESKTGGIDSDSAAIRAVVEGIGIERNNRGMADAYLKIMSMSESDLDKEMKNLLTGNEDNIIDVEAEDVTEDAAEETIPE